jgi:hypothetical protein
LGSKIAFVYTQHQQRAPLLALLLTHFPSCHLGNVLPRLPHFRCPIGLRYCVFGSGYSIRPPKCQTIYVYALSCPSRLRNTSTRCRPKDTFWTPPLVRRLHLCGFNALQSAPLPLQVPPHPRSAKPSSTTFPPPPLSLLPRQKAKSFPPRHQAFLGAPRTGDQRAGGRALIHVRPRLLGSKSIWRHSQSVAESGESTVPSVSNKYAGFVVINAFFSLVGISTRMKKLDDR